jgi:hypothetical protein
MEIAEKQKSKGKSREVRKKRDKKTKRKVTGEVLPRMWAAGGGDR